VGSASLECVAWHGSEGDQASADLSGGGAHHLTAKCRHWKGLHTTCTFPAGNGLWYFRHFQARGRRIVSRRIEGLCAMASPPGLFCSYFAIAVAQSP